MEHYANCLSTYVRAYLCLWTISRTNPYSVDSLKDWMPIFFDIMELDTCLSYCYWCCRKFVALVCMVVDYEKWMEPVPVSL